MSLDRNLSDYREAYDEAPEEFRFVIDRAFDGVLAAFREANWPVSTNDTAENLVSAITKFAILSKAQL
jgi:hypothetical protein